MFCAQSRFATVYKLFWWENIRNPSIIVPEPEQGKPLWCSLMKLVTMSKFHFYHTSIVTTSSGGHFQGMSENLLLFLCFLPSFIREIYQTICFIFWVKNVKKLFTFCFYLLFVFFKIFCSVKAVKLRGAFWHSSINFQEIMNHMLCDANSLKFWVNKVNFI